MSVLERHARYYLSLIESNTDNWQMIENELGQIRHAWRWLNERQSNLLLSYVWAMHPFFEQRALWREAIAWYERGIAAAESENQTHDAGALWSNSGAAQYALNDWVQARECYAQAREIFREIDDRACHAKTLNGLGLLAQAEGKRTEALSHYERALEFFRAEKDGSSKATVLHNMGQVYAESARYDQAIINYERALTIRREQGDQVAVALTLNNLAAALQTQADLLSPSDRDAALARAMEYQTEAQGIFAAMGYRFYEAVALGNLSTLAQHLSQFEKASKLGEQALDIFRELGDSLREAATLCNLGGVLDSLGEYGRAREYQLQALKLFEELGRQTDQANALDNIASTFEAQGILDQALAYRSKALGFWRAVGDKNAEANSLAAIGKIHLQRREFSLASQALDKARVLYKDVGYQKGEAIILNDLALARQFQGRTREARFFFEQALKLATGLGDEELRSTVSHNLAKLGTEKASVTR